MAQPFWPRHAQGEKEEKEEKEERKEEEEPMEEWVDELGFSSKDRVLLFDSVGEGICPVSPTSATEGTATTTSTLVVPVELQNRVRWFSRSAEVREVLLLNGGLKAFVARYGFLAADGHALDPELGSHFYPSHIWDLPLQEEEEHGRRRALFLSSKMASRDRKALDDLNIRYIINATREVDNEFEQTENGRFVYHRCLIADNESTDIAQHFEACWAFIDDAFRNGSGVLVHCAQGVSRSPTIVVSYLVGVKGWRLDDAYTHVRRMREAVHVNRGFYQQLCQLDALIHGKKKNVLSQS